MSLKVKKHYFLWGRIDCPYCQKAIHLLSAGGHPYTFYPIEAESQELEQIKVKFAWNTVPIIVEQTSLGDNTIIGGCSDLELLLGSVSE